MATEDNISMVIKTNNADETVALGEKLGKRLGPGDVVALVGELGAGKTTMTRGIARGLGVEADVHSPTFTLIHEHPGAVPLYHVDLYRLDTPEEAADIGVEDYIHGDGVTVIEWAERAEPLLPLSALRVDLKRVGDDARETVFSTSSARLRAILEELTGDVGSCH